MAHFQRAIRLSFFTLWAVFMTSLTYILGAPSLKVLRRALGRTKYWAINGLISVTLYAAHAQLLAVAYLSLVILVGVFDEFEEMGFSLKLSTFFTLLINSLIAAGAFALWVSVTGPAWSQAIHGWLEALTKPMTDLNSVFQINLDDLMLQLPSIAIVLWLMALYVAVLLEERLGFADAEVKGLPSLRPQLVELRLPDVVVWLAIAALFGSFSGYAPHALEVLSVNVLNVCAVLFLFQGIAVITKTFATFRVGTFWQVLAMVFALLVFFRIVSLLGLLDYWLDFRTRASKRAESFNREA